MRLATALAVPVRTLSWFIFSHFVAIFLWSVHRSWKLQNKHQNTLFWMVKVIQVVGVNTAKKLVTSACYVK